jgi:hypothetical protein
MIQHSMWQDDRGYRAGDPRPWVLDSWDTDLFHVQRSYVGFEPTGIYLRSIKTKHRITIESLIAMEQYT